MIKQIIKSIIYKTGTASWLDKFIYQKEKIKNNSSNKKFKEENKNFALPSDYFLYETYRLNYKQYKEDGLISAKEIIDWVMPYYSLENCSVLEWGCGVSRIVRHLPTLLPSSKIFGADINKEMIVWNKANVLNVQFDLINYQPPTLYEANSFNLVYAISVFTHVEDIEQEKWIKEMYRIIKPSGIFLFTTHGEKYFSHLTKEQNKVLLSKGMYTKTYKQKGHRMMSTYNEPNHLKKLLSPFFEVLEYVNGNENETKIGGQDLWIVKRKA
jgi:ubiquinone/menaquinone biosynthesis C-methylase UbiE